MDLNRLVSEIQSGNSQCMGQLWDAVHRFIRKQAHRQILFYGTSRDTDEDDYVQSSYFALVHAVETFDPNAGSFLSWLALHLKTAFAECGGYRTITQRMDPLRSAASLDAPLDDTDGDTLGDLVPDPDGSSELQDVEDDIWTTQLHTALEAILETLPQIQGDIVRRRYFDGHTQAQISQDMRLSPQRIQQLEEAALRAMKRSAELAALVDRETPFYLHVGVNRFQNTGSSAVEEIAAIRERLRRRFQSSKGEST